MLGVERRSGTNFLSDLLRLHPDVVRRPGLAEDFLLKQAHHLQGYVDALRRTWPTRWRVDPSAERALLKSLGDGLLDWLTGPVLEAPVVVTKTPSVANLELAPLLWPEATFLLLVRDGRALVESGVRSFDWSYRLAARRWAAGARAVLAFDERHRGAGLAYSVVRYEDLLTLDVPGLRKLFELCGLPSDARSDSDWAAALEGMPVRGSSDSRDTDGTVSWKPADRGAGFAPVRRFSGWAAARHRQFARAAGAEQLALGYELEPVGRAGPGASLGQLWAGRTRWQRRARRKVRSTLRWLH